MATPSFYLCDVCGNRVPESCRVFIATGRSMDGAGSYETDGEHVDLCHNHAVLAIKHALTDEVSNRRQSNYKRGLDLLEEIKRWNKQLAKSER